MTASPTGPASNRVATGGNFQGNIVQAGSIDSVIMSVQPCPQRGDVLPRQLPAAPRDFVNRNRELRFLDDLAVSQTCDSPPVIVVINGMSGVGKTALGLHWAHMNQHRFPGGQLHVDLSYYRRQGGVAVSEVLAGFLIALGMHEQFIPSRLTEQAALFRSRTSTNPTLVFVDNADQAAQVRPLIPAAGGSAVIVTSQNRLSGLAFDDAQFVDVAPLTNSESYTMLRRMVPHRLRDSLCFDDLSDVLTLCSGLPLAIRITAARLSERNRWSPRALADHLSKEESRLTRLSAGDRRMSRIFDSVADSLPESAQFTYRCLGLHDGPDFSVGAVAAAAALPEGDAIEALDQLFEANLVESTGTHRYRFHDLIRIHAHGYALQGLVHEDRNSILLRTAFWYLACASAADVAVAGMNRWRLSWPTTLHTASPPFTSSTAMGWYEAERANLIAVTRIAAACHWDEVVLRLCEALWPFYHGRKHHADWIEVHRLGISAALRAANRVAEARMRNQLARAYIELARFAEAENELAHARQAAESTDEPRARAVVLESEGVVRLRQGRFIEAADLFTRSLQINENIDDRRGVALQLYHLADALIHTGANSDEAARMLERTLSIADELGDETTAARALIVLGAAHLKSGRVSQAREVLERAADTMRRRHLWAKEIQALEMLIAVAEKLADASLANKYTERLSTLYSMTGKTNTALPPPLGSR
ncbi:ATP-binding protein [Actinokineospora sp. 24-640]